MSRGRRTLLLGVTMLIAAGVGVVAATRSTTLGDLSPRARARVLYLQALDARVRFDQAEVLRLLRASWRADSSYLPAVLETLNYFGILITPAVLHDFESLADRQDDPVRAGCIRAIAEAAKRGFNRQTSDLRRFSGPSAEYANPIGGLHHSVQRWDGAPAHDKALALVMKATMRIVWPHREYARGSIATRA